MWTEARALAEADTAEAIERSLALRAPQGMLEDLDPDAQARLDEVLADRVANPSRRQPSITYLRYLPEPKKRQAPGLNGHDADGRQTRKNTKAARAVAILRADPDICYSDVAAAVGSARKYVQVLAAAEGLQRGTRGHGPAPRAAAVARRERTGVLAYRRELAEILLRRYPSTPYRAVAFATGASVYVVEQVAIRTGLQRPTPRGRPRRVPAVPALPARYDHAAARAGRRSASKASPARVRVPGAVRKLRADRTTIRFLVDNGHSHEAVAERLEIPVDTVRFHLRTPRRKDPAATSCAIVGAAMRTQRVCGD